MNPREIPMGTQFIKRGCKDKAVWTVVDKLTTTNHYRTMTNVRYVATKQYLGTTITDFDVVAVTIQKGEVK